MKVMVMSDAHIVKVDGKEGYWCRTAVHGYEFWKRYLEVFDQVEVVARVQHVSNDDTEEFTRADGNGVAFTELPFIRGSKEYIRNFFKLNSLLKKTVGDSDCAVFRLPSLPTFMLLKWYKRTGRPYAIEVIVDPKTAYKTNTPAKLVLTKKLKDECMLANGVSYVTKDFLEKEYPCYSLINGEDASHFDSYYSSIDLPAEMISEPRKYGSGLKSIKIIHVASAINTDVKGHSTLLKISKKLIDMGFNIKVVCVGEGDRKQFYIDKTKEYGIDDKVKFVGLFSRREDLINLLNESDIMVFPSRAEGLPRALIEAMACGVPCLSTPVDGIPELLENEFLFDPDDVDGFVNKIIEIKDNPQKLDDMSLRNVTVAKEYTSEKLKQRRNAFYRKLRDSVEEK